MNRMLKLMTAVLLLGGSTLAAYNGLHSDETPAAAPADLPWSVGFHGVAWGASLDDVREGEPDAVVVSVSANGTTTYGVNVAGMDVPARALFFIDPDLGLTSGRYDLLAADAEQAYESARRTFGQRAAQEDMLGGGEAHIARATWTGPTTALVLTRDDVRRPMRDAPVKLLVQTLATP